VSFATRTCSLQAPAAWRVLCAWRRWRSSSQALGQQGSGHKQSIATDGFASMLLECLR
jgi:hypothetical protein